MALAHSPKRTAKLDQVLIFRTVNGERMGARFDLTDIRSGTAPDPQILPGDVVVVGFSAASGASIATSLTRRRCSTSSPGSEDRPW